MQQPAASYPLLPRTHALAGPVINSRRGKDRPPEGAGTALHIFLTYHGHGSRVICIFYFGESAVYLQAEIPIYGNVDRSLWLIDLLCLLGAFAPHRPARTNFFSMVKHSWYTLLATAEQTVSRGLVIVTRGVDTHRLELIRPAQDAMAWKNSRLIEPRLVFTPCLAIVRK